MKSIEQVIMAFYQELELFHKLTDNHQVAAHGYYVFNSVILKPRRFNDAELNDYMNTLVAKFSLQRDKNFIYLNDCTPENGKAVLACLLEGVYQCDFVVTDVCFTGDDLISNALSKYGVRPYTLTHYDGSYDIYRGKVVRFIMWSSVTKLFSENHISYIDVATNATIYNIGFDEEELGGKEWVEFFERYKEAAESGALLRVDIKCFYTLMNKFIDMLDY